MKGIGIRSAETFRCFTLLQFPSRSRRNGSNIQINIVTVVLLTRGNEKSQSQAEGEIIDRRAIERFSIVIREAKRMQANCQGLMKM